MNRKAVARGARALVMLAAGALVLPAGTARAQHGPPILPAAAAAPAPTAPGPTASTPVSAAPAQAPAAATPAPSPARTAARGAMAPVASAAAPTALEPDATAEKSDEGWTRGKAWSLGGLAGLYTGVGVWAYFAWYHGKPRNAHWEWNGDGFFGANTYAGGSDKLGHFYSTHVISRLSSKLLMAGGWRELPASLIASGLTAVYFTLIEVKDAYYYEFSVGDLMADLAGASLGVLMTNRPEIDRLFDFRVDYWPTPEYRAGFEDGDVNFAEDYSGQTYILALHLSGIPRLTDSRWTRWGRYVDLVGGFQSQNYKPEPADRNAIESQHLFFGAAVNFQAVLEDLYGEPAVPGRGHMSHRILHSLFEFVSPPYTTLHIAEGQRSPAEMTRPEDM